MIFDLKIYEERDDGPDLLLVHEGTGGVDILYSPGKATAFKDGVEIAAMTTFDDEPVGIEKDVIRISGIVNPASDDDGRYGYWLLHALLVLMMTLIAGCGSRPPVAHDKDKEARIAREVLGDGDDAIKKYTAGQMKAKPAKEKK